MALINKEIKVPNKKLNILITGSNGFIGKNLVLRLRQLNKFNLMFFNRDDKIDTLPSLISQTDILIHLAGVNRPKDGIQFTKINEVFSVNICNLIYHEYKSSGRKINIIFASSTQAELKNPYGVSKLAAENAFQKLAFKIGNTVNIFRLPGVYGKWCKPNYNSVVATFCYNIANNSPISINDPNTILNLVYIEDVVSDFISIIENPKSSFFVEIVPKYTITLKQLAEEIYSFNLHRTLFKNKQLEDSFIFSLYSTYLSYLPTNQFVYSILKYKNNFILFSEMIKKSFLGNFLLFHLDIEKTYNDIVHNNTIKKFLLTKGEAFFCFRHLLTNETVKLKVTSTKPAVVDIIPGWEYEIINIGNSQIEAFLWIKNR